MLSSILIFYIYIQDLIELHKILEDEFTKNMKTNPNPPVLYSYVKKQMVAMIEEFIKRDMSIPKPKPKEIEPIELVATESTPSQQSSQPTSQPPIKPQPQTQSQPPQQPTQNQHEIQKQTSTVDNRLSDDNDNNDDYDSDDSYDTVDSDTPSSVSNSKRRKSDKKVHWSYRQKVFLVVYLLIFRNIHM